VSLHDAAASSWSSYDTGLGLDMVPVRMPVTQPATMPAWSAPRPAAAEQPSAPSDEDLLEELRRQRPRTRGDCEGGVRPCPWASCRHHLLVHVDAAGRLVQPFGEASLEDLADTCALDVADRGPQTTVATAQALGISRSRVQQIETATAASLVRWLRRAEVSSSDFAAAHAAEGYRVAMPTGSLSVARGHHG
jgi:ABC-type transporter Mla MlaB component